MKICLISPPYNSAVESILKFSSPPLGLAYLASVLREDHEVKIIDANILNYTIADVRRELKSFYPDIVGITSTTSSIPQAYAVAKVAKEIREDCTVVMGGPHATFLPKQTLEECKYIDAIVKGEGERTVDELMEVVERGGTLEAVRGITFRKGNQIIDNEPIPFIKNIDEIPFPSRDLLPMSRYQFNRVKYTTMLTSRSCSFGCSFCSSSRLFGGYWRGRSPENVLEEMKSIYEEYKIKNIEFIDDTFTLNQKRAEKICDEIIKQGWDISWGASSRVDTLSEGLVEKMKKAGCWILFLGIESGSQKILDAIDKRISIEQVKKAVRILKDAGIQVLGSFMIGFLQDTVETIKQTIKFAKSLNLDYAEFSILTPYPGTPIYDYALKNNLLLTNDWSKYTSIEPIMKIKSVSERQLKALFRKAYISFYLRPRIFQNWLKNKQFILIKNEIRLAINYLRGRKMHEADLVANTVKAWLGNPISRSLLRWVSKRTEKGNKLESALKKYVGDAEKLSFKEKIAYFIVKLALDKGSESFGVSKEQMIESLKNPVVRRGITNILEGIGYYGVQRPQTTAAPFLIVWDFTKQCNLRCKHCYENAGPKPAPDELTTEEAKQAIDDFAKAGVVALSFSGGEPLIRKDFFEVAKYAAEKEFYVSVASNGTLITEKVAQKMREIGLQYVEISLDGFEKTHDEFRGVLGSWERAVEGIENCVKVGLDTCVATTATHCNLKEIPKLVEFVEKDLHAKRFIVFNFIPVSKGKDIVGEDLTPKEREELLDFLYSKLIDKSCKLDTFSTAPQYAVTSHKFAFGPVVATHFTNKAATEMLKGRTKSLTEFIGGCGAGRLYCGMEPNGDIEPCVFIPIKIGNIREQSLINIWRESSILKQIRNRDLFKGCGECEYKYICGGCRARAYAYFNDLQAPDPGCSINQKYWERIHFVRN